MFDNLLIEDENIYGDYNDMYATESFFDPYNMYMDSALESFSKVDPYYASIDEFHYVCESLMNAIDTDFEALAMEAEQAALTDNGKPKFNIVQTIKNGAAKILDALKKFCVAREQANRKHGKDEKVEVWVKRANWCALTATKLRNASSPDHVEKINRDIKEKKETFENDAKQEDMTWKEKFSGKFNSGKQKAGDAVKAAKNKASGIFVKFKSKFNKNESEGEPSMDSYIVTDSINGYEIAVEGLFSKPKTAEALLVKMQKKVGKLKSAGACDDLLAQIDNEAKKFNTAIKQLQQATANYQKSYDKKAYRQAAGPVLKYLNKSCKILKLKTIASNPKNITSEEIKKLHDFISGAKQLIVARKKLLAGGARESFIGHDNDSILSIIQDGYDDIATESLLEEHDECIEMVALATEGIIDPDFKRAHRIKFGEKTRAIKGILKKARQAKKAKDYTAAIACYQEAKAGYKALLAEAKKLPDRMTGFVHKDSKTGSSAAKVNVINWCIKKMGECDDAIEAIRDKQAKMVRKSGISESYLDNILMFESALEGLMDDDTFDLDSDYDSYDDYEDDFDDMDSGIESLLI